MFSARQISLAVRRHFRPNLQYHHTQRSFSCTSRLQAAEPQDDTFLSNFKNTPIFRKLADKPEALIALRDFAAILKERGIDPSSGPPSTTQMLRLAANSEFREAAQRVVTELKNAGVDLTSQDAMQELMGAYKGSKPGGN
ncbi:hypothetical protein SERLA73DRAFT_177267 [Serpula lacrymans var. lacrymans S7.3]|uniref:Uncharacterized protein n=2 Tax=Serpula lacrymans var. lacrymans TaxID=341189 RepID=F8PNP5_SERL3|nr:uncharacterized protein SERLADRAFT_460776 [Serpula lacrymans var. lacrymans S7.9]EGO01772.1 hypothetical protein SERLA73DRAFT_177267 [Serpula lacrymans var. lacrymans S7.3]EGO27408.1 hypothetical protein SERLADRAFT_460776 [Serpula lacrymans var. lacrymans S7.9]